MSNAALRLSRVSADDLADVETIFDDLEAYSLHVDGVARRAGAAHEFATALPQGSGVRSKHAFVARQQGRPVGLLDIIDGYPTHGIAFIGLLAVRQSAQEAGVGGRIYAEAERFMKDDLKARIARLAVVGANPVAEFWRKMGFQLIGRVKPYAGQNIVSHLQMMEKAL